MEKSLNTSLFSIVCPACGKARISLPKIAQDITCPQCFHNFPAKDGFIDLLVKQPENVPSVDAPMEWNWLVDIYESPLWRGNPLFGIPMAIPFYQEQRKILEALALKGDETILDLACGPGIYARALAQKVPQGHVIGLDLSVPMLSYAANKARQQNLENILFLRGNAMDLPFTENGFDAVNCCGALHLFPEIEKVINDIYKILKPGGRFTAAAARCPEGKLAQKIVAYVMKRSGLTYYADQRTLALLQDSGFAQKNLLHHKRFWFIVYGKK